MLRRKDRLFVLVEQTLTPDDATELEPVLHIPSLRPHMWDGWYSHVALGSDDRAQCRVCQAQVPIQEAHFCYFNVFSTCPGTFLCDKCYAIYSANA
jgi:hypothetical protein